MSDVHRQIEEVWRVEQEILDVIHHVCVENNLRYSLSYGTLLGAVRHGGFIPWDDDIDIMMPREDYDRLLEIWDHVAPEGYIVSNGEKEEDCYLNFSKIVKNNTTFLQHETDRNKNIHKGIFVDIFPGDRLAPGKVSALLQYIACAVNLLYSRGYTSGTGGFIGFVEHVLLLVPRKYHKSLRTSALKYVTKWNGEEQSAYIFPCTISECKKHYQSTLFDNTVEIPFNGKHYFCTSVWHNYLAQCYGDYMKLPPEEDRVWKHHPIIIDFEHNYEELNI